MPTQKPIQFVLEVNLLDHAVGLVEKQQAHQQCILHRAFSIFIFRPHHSSFQVLLQKRAKGKYHSSGLWTNTCCSHAEANTPIEITAKNRLKEEMGFSCELFPVESFYYKADLGNGMFEHKIDHIFVSLHDPKYIQPDPLEFV